MAWLFPLYNHDKSADRDDQCEDRNDECHKLEAAGLPDPTFDSNTFILKTTVLSAAFEKSAVQTEKVGGLDENPAVSKIEFSKIADLCSEMGYSKPTITNIEILYRNVDVNQVFGAAYIKMILSCADSTARGLISKLRDMKVVVSVAGKGKGMYRFKYTSEMQRINAP